jgi:hypothetical protein
MPVLGATTYLSGWNFGAVAGRALGASSQATGPCASRAGPIPKQLMQSRHGGILRLGRFSLLVNGCLGDLSKSLVGRLFLFECFLQKSDGVVETELFGPCYERAVARDFVVLDRLGSGRRPASSAGEPL